MNYLDKLKYLTQRPDTDKAIQAGDRITWQRGDGTTQSGVVDAIYTDDAGTRWAFVTMPGGSWAAVNCKFVKGAA